MVESYISVNVKPGDVINAGNLAATWTVEGYEEFSMFIQMNFDNAVYVSSGAESDSVQLNFKSEQIFFD